GHAVSSPSAASPGRAPGAQRPGGRPAAREPWPPTIGELCTEFGEICRSAVDPLEIASALEFEGLGDQQAADRFGRADVFDLAEEMYRLVPRDPSEPDPPADPWQGSRLRPAVHALLYGIPAVCFTAIGGLFAGPGVLTGLVVALVAGWSLAQALAYAGYLRLGQSGTAQAQRTLRAGLAIGLPLAVAVMLATRAVTGARVPVTGFGIGEAAYMLGAAVLMVLGDEAWLFAALTPGLAAGAAFLAAGRPRGLEPLVWVGLAVTALACVGFAVLRTPDRGGPGGRHLSRTDLPGLAAAAGFGMFAAGLFVFPTAVIVYGRGRIPPGALLAIMPLSLSMGVAEWSLLWYRRRTRSLLLSGIEIEAFASRARLALLGAVLQYLAVTVTLTVATAALARATGLLPVSAADIPQVTAYVLLGVAMFVALTLQALGLRAVPVAACGGALGIAVALRSLGVAAEFVAYGSLLVVLGGYAAARLGRTIRHVY
ncbi:MAG: hypothetical protein ACYCVZ_16085, partial [Streptosporangiaceae bacterium]